MASNLPAFSAGMQTDWDALTCIEERICSEDLDLDDPNVQNAVQAIKDSLPRGDSHHAGAVISSQQAASPPAFSTESSAQADGALASDMDTSLDTTNGDAHLEHLRLIETMKYCALSDDLSSEAMAMLSKPNAQTKLDLLVDVLNHSSAVSQGLKPITKQRERNPNLRLTVEAHAKAFVQFLKHYTQNVRDADDQPLDTWRAWEAELKLFAMSTGETMAKALKPTDDCEEGDRADRDAVVDIVRLLSEFKRRWAQSVNKRLERQRRSDEE
eukprot:m.13093 g.13093  ORF g.13093 m.13093 type:complete len:270 (-) comp10091_c0_seq1:62-871(-)